MAGNIFISYRRADSAHAAGRLVDRLEQHFSPDRIFMDVDSIEPGLDFAEVIDARVACSDTMLVIIGPHWIDAAGPSGTRRLDDPADVVRMEIEAALARNIRVIPVLVDGAPPPATSALPESLRLLAKRQAIRIDHVSFNSDAQRLAASLARMSRPAPQTVVEAVPSLAPTARPPGRGGRDILGWFAALSPVLFSLGFFGLYVPFGFSASDFRWFEGISSSRTAAALPLLAASCVMAVRLIRPPPPSGKVLIVGAVTLTLTVFNLFSFP